MRWPWAIGPPRRRSAFLTLGTEAAKMLDETVWLHESHELAKTYAYAEVMVALRKMESAGSTVSGAAAQPGISEDRRTHG